ncbi:MAG TPA: gluconokinase [Usitatibacter sp.]|nr:gluconokinase [Usitatibacter sp.]
MTPSVIIVMGVAGSGKSTVASQTAQRLDWRFAEADTFHSAANIAKMRDGIPLTDEDRWPWLDAIAAWIDSMRSAGQHCVVACSALKRAYRVRLAAGHHDVRFVYLKGSYEIVAARMSGRTGHYMPLSLLRSQFETLEEPDAAEDAVVMPIEKAPEEIVAAIVAVIGV